MQTCRFNDRRERRAFTLIEVAIAIAIAALVMAGMFQCYILASNRAQFACYSLAANATAAKQLENIVCASWVVSGVATTDVFNPVLTNSAVNVSALCMPTYGSNVVYATNYATITEVSTNPPYLMIRVDCVWNFLGQGVFTNTVAAMRAMNL